MLKRKKDGSYQSLSSVSDARLARIRIDGLLWQIDKLAKKAGIPAILQEVSELQAVLDLYVLDSEEFESDTWQAKRVQASRRSWDVDKLKRLLPASVFKSVVKPVVDNAAIDEAVKKDLIDIDVIGEALIEAPNKPYVKWTPKSDVQASAEATAAKLESLLS